VFEALEGKGTEFRRGQLVLLAAPPGVGKSGFASTLALKSEVPTLYFSADSDAFTQLTRAISILTGNSLEDSAKRVLDDDLGGVTALLDRSMIRFVYDASPDLDRIQISLQAFEEVYGDYPDLVIVDNITNIRTEFAESADPFAGLEPLMDYLHTMARGTGACVFGLHHVTGMYNDANKPIPLSGIKNQIGRVPEVVITLFRKVSEFGPVYLCVSTVKNRGGKADPSGEDYAELEFIGDSMTIRDIATNNTGFGAAA